MEANLNLLTYVATIAIILAAIGYIAMLVDLYGNYLYNFLSRIMDRDNKALVERQRKEKVIANPEDFTQEDYNDLPPICGTPDVIELEEEMKGSVDPEWTDKGLKVTVTQPDGKKEVLDDFGMDFLSDKFKEGDKKVANGEISCNLDNPEDCINCGS